MLLGAGSLHDAETIIKNGIVKRFMLVAQGVRVLRGFVLREHAFPTPIATDNIDAPSLHEVAGQPHANGVTVKSSVFKFLIEQAQQPLERCLIATVGGGGEQDEVSLTIFRQTLEQSEALLAVLVGAHARVGFIDHYKLRT